MSHSPFDVIEAPRRSPLDFVDPPPGRWDTSPGRCNAPPGRWDTPVASQRPEPKRNARGGVWQSPHGQAGLFWHDELVHVPMPSSMKKSFPEDGLGSYSWLRGEAQNCGVSVSFRLRGAQNWLILKGPSRESMLLLKQLFDHMDGKGFSTKDLRAACKLTSTAAETEREQETVPATATASNPSIEESPPDQASLALAHSGTAEVAIDSDVIMNAGEPSASPPPSMENPVATNVEALASAPMAKASSASVTTNIAVASLQAIKAGHLSSVVAMFQKEQTGAEEETPVPGTPTPPVFDSRFGSFLSVCHDALRNLDNQLLTSYDNGLPFLLAAADSLLTSISRPVAEDWMKDSSSMVNYTGNPSTKVCFCISAWPSDYTLLMNTLPINLVLNIDEFKWVTFHVVTFGNDTLLQQELRKHLGWVILLSIIPFY